ncbi:glycosyltransferase family 9 protein [Desulfovibrio ferrophilus]|uniref:Glycosyltransferase 9 family protein n=1 Tax=Desulfovibrio ferrophilus TaxID=241368 RepID=A0A2Z6AWQ6_9BACT|nr:glycosyltransferase family 9 protein [Desulfovibrio ferrophilus]BBD07635.1 glycosyltransferase 9 family protein [Desulfovibrio ferrophilus]
MPDTPAKRHLVIQLARFGDLMQTKRLMATLMAEQGVEVHLAVDHSLAELAGLVYPGVVVHPLTAHASGVETAAQAAAANLPVFAELRSLKFKRVYNLNFSGLNVAVAGLFDPTTVVGYRLEHGHERRGVWQDMAMRWTRLRRFAGLNLVDFWGLFAPQAVAPGEVNPIARRGGRGVGVVLAGRETRRSLAPQVLSTLAAAVTQGIRAERVVLLGSKAEQGLAKEMMATMPSAIRSRTVDQVGRTDWSGLIDELTDLDAVLTPDTGTMHLAAHLGVPVHAFFLSSAWCWETGPYGMGHRVWQTAEDCAPCLESTPCPYDVKCAAPFASRDLIRHLSGNPAFEVPEGLMGLVSGFDALGVVYRPVLGEDALASRRLKFRQTIGSWLGLSMGGDPDHELAQELFAEEDWMLDRGTLPENPLEFFERAERNRA